MAIPFADDPAENFNFRCSDAHKLSLAEAETLQLEAAQRRFTAMSPAITPLATLADAQDIDNIDNLDQLPALMFPHSIYKAYPEHLIEEYDFPKLTQWLSRLTINDLSAVMDRDFDTLDAWQDALDEETDINIMHSSGTTGRLSFYPRGKQEIATQTKHTQMTMVDWMEPPDTGYADPNYHVIWPSYDSGRMAALKSVDFYRKLYMPSPDQLHPLIPYGLSTDLHHFVMQVNQRKAEGINLAPEPSAYVQTQIAQAQEPQNSHDQHIDNMLDMISGGFRLKKTVLSGAMLNLYQLAKKGLAKGIENAFAPGSVIHTFGGLKGMEEPEDLEEIILKFSGISAIKYGYSMTELTSAFLRCSANRYHVPPWIIAYILDPLTGNPKPREGVQEGRGAFFDLVAQTYWGGVISADHLHISWTPCSCGRTSPHIKDDIKRVTDTPEREHYIGPTPNDAIDAALMALSEGLG